MTIAKLLFLVFVALIASESKAQYDEEDSRERFLARQVWCTPKLETCQQASNRFNLTELVETSSWGKVVGTTVESASKKTSRAKDYPVSDAVFALLLAMTDDNPLQQRALVVAKSGATNLFLPVMFRVLPIPTRGPFALLWLPVVTPLVTSLLSTLLPDLTLVDLVPLLRILMRTVEDDNPSVRDFKESIDQIKELTEPTLTEEAIAAAREQSQRIVSFVQLVAEDQRNKLVPVLKSIYHEVAWGLVDLIGPQSVQNLARGLSCPIDLVSCETKLDFARKLGF